MKSSTRIKWLVMASLEVEGGSAAALPEDGLGDPRRISPSIDSTLGMKLLPSILGLTAGAVDLISFLGLGGLFAAHITGNLVILAAHLVDGGAASAAHILQQFSLCHQFRLIFRCCNSLTHSVRPIFRILSDHNWKG